MRPVLAWLSGMAFTGAAAIAFPPQHRDMVSVVFLFILSIGLAIMSRYGDRL